MNTLLSWMRKSLDKKLQQEKKDILRFMSELYENNYEMQSIIMQSETANEDSGDFMD